MSKKSILVDKRFELFNCAQTVFSLFASELGIDEKTALQVASGFGGGMACAETCGAVTGAYMVIGMKHGHFTPDPEEKAKTKARIIQFNDEFRKIHQSLKCKELLGTDITTPEGAEFAKQNGYFNTKCPEFIKTACSILEDNY